MVNTEQVIHSSQVEVDEAPMTNRGKVGTYLYPKHYSRLPEMPPLPYWNAVYDSENHVTYSVDMVRLTFELDRDPKSSLEQTVERLCRWLERYPAADDYDSWTSRKVGSYAQLHVMYWGCLKPDPTPGNPEHVKVDRSLPSCVALKVGFGLNCGREKPKWSVGFIEFNPNKCAQQAAWFLMRLADSFFIQFELSRWDFAVDVPVPRKSVRTHKDARKYECHISSDITEYLGQRDAPARVKVYDKAAESKLINPLTRIELTCAGNWDVSDALRAFPRCYTCAAPPDEDEVTPSLRFMVASLGDKVESGQDIAALVAMLDKRTRRQVLQLLESPVVSFSEDAWRRCADFALSWSLPVAFVSYRGL